MDIRAADSTRDAEAIAAIYAPYVADTVISFEDVPPTAAEMAARIERLTKTHAWVVAEHGGELLGYAYGCPHRERAAYRWATEVSVYVDPRHQRRGAGRALYEALFGLLADQGYRIGLAGIALPNDASVAAARGLRVRARGRLPGDRLQAGNLVGRRLVAARPRARLRRRPNAPTGTDANGVRARPLLSRAP